MIYLKARAWDDKALKFVSPKFFESESFHAIDVRGFDLCWSTTIKAPCGREIWFGDIYYNAGYGNLHIRTMSDILLLIEGLAENDIGAYLGNEYENPELLS